MRLPAAVASLGGAAGTDELAVVRNRVVVAGETCLGSHSGFMRRGSVLIAVGGGGQDTALARRRPSDDGAGEPPRPVELPDPAILILDCRTRFVWTDFEVIRA